MDFSLSSCLRFERRRCEYSQTQPERVIPAAAGRDWDHHLGAQELGIYVKGAINSGVSVDEIREVLIHATVYCGTPAGRQRFLAAHAALKTEGAL
ncbi:MAG: carboxymuconolactone decarboxylase family protein [Deltaproteobacteria bacterium]|nr:carboxymuconolactone decarboxylase family protein [Deltaproteobacteria bacterium]